MTNPLATGQHLLLIDACGVNEKIAEVEAIIGFFDDLIDTLGMVRLGDCAIRRVNQPDNQGISATQMTTTSHISFHADEISMGFYLDVMSCKPFDNEKVLALVRDTFEPQKLYSTNLTRELVPCPGVWQDEAEPWR